VPAAAGLILLGRPLLQLLYQRGAFDTAATDAVFVALRFYALGLVGHACLELAARAFFAQQDTVTPLLIAAGSAAVNVVLGMILMGPLGYGGLALANSLAISAEVLALLLILRRRWDGVEGREMLDTLRRVGVATLLMAIAIIAVERLGWSASAGPLGLVAVAGVVGGLVYGAAGWLLGLQALRWLLDALGGHRGAVRR
jgi:putative peptidoglycan lipid II flippase